MAFREMMFHAKFHAIFSLKLVNWTVYDKVYDQRRLGQCRGTAGLRQRGWVASEGKACAKSGVWLGWNEGTWNPNPNLAIWRETEALYMVWPSGSQTWQWTRTQYIYGAFSSKICLITEGETTRCVFVTNLQTQRRLGSAAWVVDEAFGSEMKHREGHCKQWGMGDWN